MSLVPGKIWNHVLLLQTLRGDIYALMIRTYLREAIIDHLSLDCGRNSCNISAAFLGDFAFQKRRF
jgi:hypothetical protein